MMGSPFYYDVLFDDGPGDVVFHDCMWSGICTCCIQLLHQDSFFYTNESPDLKKDLSYQQQQPQHQSHQHQQHQQQQQTQYHHHLAPHHLQPAASLHLQHPAVAVHQHQVHQSSQHQARSPHIHSSTAQPQANNNHNNHNNATQHTLQGHPQQHQQAPDQSQDQNLILNNNNHHHHHHHHHNNANTNTTTNNNNSITSDKVQTISAFCSSSSTSISPDYASTTLSATASPDTPSSLSPKPVRRREHNDSERKRRDHLRNAFNFLRDQVPRFKAINKKPPRIQILHEATLYVQRIMKESDELERRLAEEKEKHEMLKNH